MKKYEHNYGKNPEGVLSTTSGYATETTNFGESAFGILNKSTRDKNNFTTPEVVSSSTATLFSVGNGSDGIRKNIIELKADGTVLISGVGGYDGTNPDAATGIADKMQGIEGSIDGFEEALNSISVVKDETNDLVYTLMVDGEERGSINIPKDQFLKSVTYDEDTSELVFTFVTSDSDNQEVRVSIPGLSEIPSLNNCVTLDGDQTITGNKTFNTNVVATGFAVVEGTSDKVLTADGGTISTDEIAAKVPQPDLNPLQTAIGSNTYEGSNYLTKETNITDAVIQLDEEIKATNDNLALEHANAEAAYAKKTDLNSYLPLTGGSILYRNPWESEDVSYNHIHGLGIWINNDSNNKFAKPYASLCRQGQDDSLSFNLRLLNPKEVAPGKGVFIETQGSYDLATSPTDRSNVCALAFGNPDTGPSYADLAITQVGIFIKDKTTSDLLNAAGGTTTLKTLGGESILGTGNFDVATEEDIQALFN